MADQNPGNPVNPQPQFRVPTCDELCARAARAHSLFNFKEICTNSGATFGKIFQ